MGSFGFCSCDFVFLARGFRLSLGSVFFFESFFVRFRFFRGFFVVLGGILVLVLVRFLSTGMF